MKPLPVLAALLWLAQPAWAQSGILTVTVEETLAYPSSVPAGTDVPLQYHASYANPFGPSSQCSLTDVWWTWPQPQITLNGSTACPDCYELVMVQPTPGGPDLNVDFTPYESRLWTLTVQACVTANNTCGGTMAGCGSAPVALVARRLVLLLGYWPPTDIGIGTRHGMLWKWSPQQNNYQTSGYDVLAISPTFNAPTAVGPPPEWGKGTGDLTVDYRKTSQFIWNTVKDKKPIAIMSFSRGQNDKSWVIEQYARNLKQADWITFGVFNTGPYAGGGGDDFSPYNGNGAVAGNPPDPTKTAWPDVTKKRADYANFITMMRENNLPLNPIKDAVNLAANGLNGKVTASINDTGDVGAFVSEYMAYHGPWYRDYSQANFRCGQKTLKAGHVHVGIQVAPGDGETAVDLQLKELFKVLP
jgi:hypothetical protein